MKSRRFLLLPLTFALLTACTASPSSISPGYSYPSPSASSAPKGLESLLTGQVVSTDEQQLRDIKNRQILLDFPLKVGVVFYNLNTRLEDADLKAQFDQLKSSLKNSGQVRETLQIPNSLISSAITVEELRKLGARFQCDIMVLVTGSHSFEKAKSQNLSFFDSFSDKASYESKIKLEAIALDVFTGTLLSPFNAAVTGTATLLDRAANDFNTRAYTYQKDTEAKAWESLRSEALERLNQLRQDVDKRKATLNQASPQPIASPSPSAAPSASPTVQSSPTASTSPNPAI